MLLLNGCIHKTNDTVYRSYNVIDVNAVVLGDTFATMQAPLTRVGARMLSDIMSTEAPF